jgi:signal peptidase I
LHKKQDNGNQIMGVFGRVAGVWRAVTRFFSALRSDETALISSGDAKVDGVYHTLEWLITAFAGTLVFIFFQMQVYRIPTGSMAETLRGSHFRMRCQQCGYRYDYDFYQDHYKRAYGIPPNVTPSKDVKILPVPPRCPSCGFDEPAVQVASGKAYVYRDEKILPGRLSTVFKGDQIFVLKCIYQFFEPKRWDVIVFKNPLEPEINYIKRLIGRPGETVQLIDGDVYIDGQIARKPEAVQDELWMVVFDNDYQPVQPTEKGFNGHAWRQPYENRVEGKWDLAAAGPTVFGLDDPSGAVSRVWFNPAAGNGFRATYAYDDPTHYDYLPVCSDLMVRCYATIGAESAFGVRLSKYGIAYEGWVYADGRMAIVRIGAEGTAETLAEGTTTVGGAGLYRFANADHRLCLDYGDTRLEFDLGLAADAAGTARQHAPAVELAGSGAVTLRHIGLFRDIHYITGNALRATEASPLTLGEDQFFACGDNSPYSYDSRLWKDPGKGNNGVVYPAGIVPREYLVGKAVFVHWPGGWRFRREPLRWIPNPDGMKIIYGGE